MVLSPFSNEKCISCVHCVLDIFCVLSLILITHQCLIRKITMCEEIKYKILHELYTKKKTTLFSLITITKYLLVRVLEFSYLKL